MKRTFFFLALCTAILGTTSCVSSKKLKAEQARYARLDSFYVQTQTQLKDCRSAEEEAARRRAQLEADLDVANKQLAMLKENNNTMVNQLKDLSVISSSQAESIKKSLDNIGSKDTYIQDLQRVDKVDDYFHLSDENRRLHHMNDSLLNQLRGNFVPTDTMAKLVTDSTRYDTITPVRRYLYRDAKVVYNSVIEESNYLQLNRGAAQGIRDNMAVINSDGAAVGVVVNTSKNFSQVMSLLHVKSRVTAALKKTGDYGTLEWDAEDPRFLTLKGIPKNATVNSGDTVVTSVYSYNFPPGFMVGTVAAIQTEKASGFYVLKIKTAVNFNNIQQVFVVENLQREEQLSLMEDTEKKIEQVKQSR